MRRIRVLLALGLFVMAVFPAHAAVSWLRRDLVVELRQIGAEDEAREAEDGRDVPGGYSVSTITADDRMATHRVRVQNGEKAQMQFSQSQPVQWVQAASAQSTTLSVRGASATQNTGAITQERAMLETGYTLVLTPRWGGGSKHVSQIGLQPS